MAREGKRRAGDGPGLSSHPLPSMLLPCRHTWTCSQPDRGVPSGAPVDEACARLVGVSRKHLWRGGLWAGTQEILVRVPALSLMHDPSKSLPRLGLSLPIPR